MKKVSVFLLIALLLVMISAVFVSSAAAKKDAFSGTWYSTDVDGSNQTLKIAGGGGDLRHVKYDDDAATLCGVDPVTHDILFAASAKGMLTVTGNTLAGSLPVHCLSTPPTFFGDTAFGYTYDPLTDTLTDVHLVAWHR